MHWIYPSVGGGIFAFGIGSIGDITFTLVIDTYHEVCASTLILRQDHALTYHTAYCRSLCGSSFHS